MSDLMVRPVDENLRGVLIAENKIDAVLTVVKGQLEYLYDLLPNSFEDWNPENCAKERDDVELLYTELTLNKDLYSLLKFENAFTVLQTRAFESDLHSPVSERSAKSPRTAYKFTKEDYLEMGFEEEQLEN